MNKSKFICVFVCLLFSPLALAGKQWQQQSLLWLLLLVTFQLFIIFKVCGLKIKVKSRLLLLLVFAFGIYKPWSLFFNSHQNNELVLAVFFMLYQYLFYKLLCYIANKFKEMEQYNK